MAHPQGRGNHMTAPGSDPGFESPVVAVTPAPSLRGAYRRPTDRDYEVLRAVVRQGGRRLAAPTLGITEWTIKGCLEHLRAWHGATTTTHLAALVMRDVGDIFGVKADWRAA